jgi:hypothetical protein
MCSVGCGVVNWSLGVVFRFNVVRRSSRCVVSRGCVLLGHLSYSCLAWGRVIHRGCGVVARGSISCGVIIWSLIGVVIGRLGVVFSRFGGVISWNLGVVARNKIMLRNLGVVSWGNIRVILRWLGGVALGSLGVVIRIFDDVARGSVICGVIFCSLGDVVIVSLSLVTGWCECCCWVVWRRCGALVSTIPRRHQYTSDRPSLQRYDKRQQHDITINYAVNNLNINIQYGT